VRNDSNKSHKQKHAFYVQYFFSENSAVYNIGKCGGAREAANDNMAAGFSLD
jgi:hypothetical protein